MKNKYTVTPFLIVITLTFIVLPTLVFGQTPPDGAGVRFGDINTTDKINTIAADDNFVKETDNDAALLLKRDKSDDVDLTSEVTGVLPIANVATGTPDGTKFVRDDGTLQNIPGGGDALTANPLSQFAATTSAQLAGVITNETGTGFVVLGTSPNITTPTGIVKGDVGLANADNTSDANKPISTATQTALDLKRNNADSVPATEVDVTNGMSVLNPGTAQNVFEQVDLALLNSRSTGVVFGGELSGEGTTTIQIAAGEGSILDNSIPSAPTYTPVMWNATSIAHTGAILNHVLLDNTGTPFVLTDFPTTIEMTENIYLGLASFNVTIISAIAEPTILQQLADQLRTFMDDIGDIHVGGDLTPRAADLTVAQSDLVITRYGVNSEISFQDPHRKPISGSAGGAASWNMASQLGMVGGTVSTIPVTDWDNAGVIETIPGGSNTSGIWSYYIFSTGAARLLYPQTTYSSLSEAEAAIPTYNPITTAVYANAVRTVRIAATKSATNLQLTDVDAVFIYPDKFGDFGSGVAGASGASSFAVANNLSEGTPATMRTNVGVVIGTDVQAFDATNIIAADIDSQGERVAVWTDVSDATATALGTTHATGHEFGAAKPTESIRYTTVTGAALASSLPDLSTIPDGWKGYRYNDDSADPLSVFPLLTDAIGTEADGVALIIEPGEFAVFERTGPAAWTVNVSWGKPEKTFWTVSGTMTRNQMRNGHINYVTTSSTLTMLALDETEDFYVIGVGSAVATLDPNASDNIKLDGVAASDGEAIVSSGTSGDIAGLVPYDATGTYASTSGFMEETP